MKRVLAVMAVIVAVLSVSVACGSNGRKGDPAACRAALLQQVKVNLTTGQTGTTPSSCVGLDKRTLSRISGEVFNEAVKEEFNNG